MRKLYALLAGFIFFLAGNKIQAQNNPNVVSFTSTINSGNTVSFTNTSTLSPTLANVEKRAWWSFGDGAQQSSPALGNMQHHYSTAGTYNVCLRIFAYVNNDSTQIGSFCHSVILEAPTVASCTADFQYQDSVILGPPAAHKVKFTAFGSNSQNRPIIAVCWNFGDGSPQQCIQAAATNPPANLLTAQHIYTGPGPYNACVKIYYQEGCQSERCRILQLQAVPPPDTCHANWERIEQNATGNPLLAYFKALPSHNNNKKPVRICWQFGDGRDTCIQYPTSFTGTYAVSHLYPTMGIYNVCVNILYDGGCEARKCESTRVGRPDSCTANFERIQSTVSSGPRTVTLKALPWHNNGKKPSRICWNFGDGHDTCIQYLNIYNGTYTVQHTYAQPGTYQVCVSIHYYGDCESRNCSPVIVTVPDECGADFERIASVSNNLQVANFRALLTHNNNRKPSKICWTFGDGRDTCINYTETYTGQYTVEHHYAQAGQYQVCVRITYFGGCESTRCKPVTIVEQPVTCAVNLFEITPSITSLTRGFLAVPNSVPARAVERVCWSFGDGVDTCIMLTNAAPNTNLTISHNYPGPGNYQACVRVKYVGGCEAQSCREVVIRAAAGVCGGFIQDSLVGPRTYRFRGNSIHAPNDQPVSFNWTFGDGTSGTGADITHQYAQGGEYRVCLTIRTAQGCETKICKSVIVATTGQPSLVINPNPVGNELHAQFLSTHAETVNIRIINQFQTTVRSYSRVAVVGNNNWAFDVSTLTPGIYTFIIQSPNQLASTIFIKL